MAEPVRVVTCTLEELRALVCEAMREVMRAVPSAPEEHAYTSTEAAEYLRLSTSGLRHHIRLGHIKPDMPGQRGRTSGHRFRRVTLDAFLRGTNDGTSNAPPEQAKKEKPRPRW